jgi:ABC-type sugar transport system ATPase subunit
VLTVDHISKSFPGVKALDDVSFSVASGSIHGLVGENGAGKSTIIKILSGIYQPDDGKVLIDGKELSFSSVREAQNHGIATIFQELTTIPELTVYENVLLGREPVNRLGVLNRKEMREKVSSILAKIGAVFSEDESLARLSIANQQVVEICKALILHSKIIIMDEPTSSLTEKEVNSLFSLIRHLKEDGITVLYVSHKL